MLIADGLVVIVSMSALFVRDTGFQISHMTVERTLEPRSDPAIFTVPIDDTSMDQDVAGVLANVYGNSQTSWLSGVRMLLSSYSAGLVLVTFFLGIQSSTSLPSVETLPRQFPSACGLSSYYAMNTQASFMQLFSTQQILKLTSSRPPRKAHTMQHPCLGQAKIGHLCLWSSTLARSLPSMIFRHQLVPQQILSQSLPHHFEEGLSVSQLTCPIPQLGSIH